MSSGCSAADLRQVGDAFGKYWALTSPLTDDGVAGAGRSHVFSPDWHLQRPPAFRFCLVASLGLAADFFCYRVVGHLDIPILGAKQKRPAEWCCERHGSPPHPLQATPKHRNEKTQSPELVGRAWVSDRQRLICPHVSPSLTPQKGTWVSLDIRGPETGGFPSSFLPFPSASFCQKGSLNHREPICFLCERVITTTLGIWYPSTRASGVGARILRLRGLWNLLLGARKLILVSFLHGHNEDQALLLSLAQKALTAIGLDL